VADAIFLNPTKKIVLGIQTSPSAVGVCGHRELSNARSDGLVESMHVEFYGVYRTIAGNKTIEIESAHGMTARETLQMICARYPALSDELFNEHGDVYVYIPIYVNGRNPRLLENGLNTMLQPDDMLSLFSPISSGRMNVEVLRERSE
jgi:MoaD family protein